MEETHVIGSRYAQTTPVTHHRHHRHLDSPLNMKSHHGSVVGQHDVCRPLIWLTFSHIFLSFFLAFFLPSSLSLPLPTPASAHSKSVHSPYSTVSPG